MTGAKPAKAALIGGGVIGSGWAARLVLFGVDTAIHDPAPQTAAKVARALDNARRAYAAMGWPVVREGGLTVADTIEEAVADAGFIQESLPETEALKVRVLGEASRAAPADALIASSTSGLLPTRLAAGITIPQRFVVGHPFVPPYLMPLVEVCGGRRTAPETVRQAMALYAALGMRPLHVRREVDGFVADRLMEALWREALHLVNDGVATTAEIDDAIRNGPGLRWAFMGPFLTYRIAGGEAGMRHFMAQFGPALKWPWTKLEAPELTDELLERIVAQSDAQAAAHPKGDSVADLERWRDEKLIAVLKAVGAGRE